MLWPSPLFPSCPPPLPPSLTFAPSPVPFHELLPSPASCLLPLTAPVLPARSPSSHLPYQATRLRPHSLRPLCAHALPFHLVSILIQPPSPYPFSPRSLFPSLSPFPSPSPFRSLSPFPFPSLTFPAPFAFPPPSPFPLLVPFPLPVYFRLLILFPFPVPFPLSPSPPPCPLPLPCPFSPSPSPPPCHPPHPHPRHHPRNNSLLHPVNSPLPPPLGPGSSGSLCDTPAALTSRLAHCCSTHTELGLHRDRQHTHTPHVTERVRVYAAGRRMGTGMGPTVAEAKRDGAAKALLAWGKVFGGGVGE
ncbi:unnamed protein product [Closterium sp. NIES-65]|nr:unnamed protein product [Closterium sp. NIES-65]